MDNFTKDFLEKRLENLSNKLIDLNEELEKLDILDSYTRGINIGSSVTVKSEIDSIELLFKIHKEVNSGKKMKEDEEFIYDDNRLTDKYMNDTNSHRAM